MKEGGIAYQRPGYYEDIVMSKNSAFGAVTGGCALIFGFAMVWHIWWLAILGASLIALTLIVRSSDDDSEYLLSASEVEKIEDRRFQDLARVTHSDRTQDAFPIPDAALPGPAS
jgi:cytochrome o ubiquinol oxidase subunit 1